MNKQATIEKPLLVTLEGAELTLVGSDELPVMNVEVMTYGEEVRSIFFPMPLSEYLNLLKNNSLTGLPRNPNYPRFEMVTKGGEPLIEVTQDNIENSGISLKRTERAA
jgi:hypothetical protein